MRVCLALLLLVVFVSPALAGGIVPNKNSQVPVWFKSSGYTKEGLRALEILRNSSNSGISPSRYSVEELESYSKQTVSEQEKIISVNEQVSRNMIMYLLDLNWGVNNANKILDNLEDKDKQS